MKLIPSLSFNGQCATAFKFYEQCLGGEILSLMPYEGSPMESDVPAEWKSKVMHTEMKFGDFKIMGTDAIPGQYEPTKGMSLTLDVNEPAEAERVFNALAENGTIEMPIAETFWAKKFGALVDQFGISWMVNCSKDE